MKKLKLHLFLVTIIMLVFTSCIDEWMQYLADEPLDPPTWLYGEWTFSTEPDDNEFYSTVTWSFSKNKVTLTEIKYGLLDDDGWTWDYGNGEKWKEDISNDEYKVTKKNDSVFRLECYVSTMYQTVITFTYLSETEILCTNNNPSHLPWLKEYTLTKVINDNDAD